MEKLDNKNNESLNTKDVLKDQKEAQMNIVCDIFKFNNNEKKQLNNLKNKLDFYGLNIEQQLLGYNKYITKNLSKLHPNIQNKIKKSIKLKILGLNSKLGDLISNNKDINNKWIINETIQNELHFVNDILLPSAVIYQNKDSVNWSIYDKDAKLEELEEMFNAPVNEDGDFDEGLFSTQITFDNSINYQANFLQLNGVEKIKGIDLLSEKDKKIEGDVMIKYLAFVGTMLIPYAGAATSVPSDFKDLFTSEEGVLDTMKDYHILSGEELNYKMDKHWFDTIFGFVGLVGTAFGAQAVSKGGKFTKVITKLERLGFTTETIFKEIKKYQDIFKAKLFEGKEITKKGTKKVFEGINKTKEVLKNSELVRSLIGLSKKAKSQKDINHIKKSLLDLLDSIPVTKSKELVETMFPEIRNVLNSNFPGIVFDGEGKARMTDREFIKWWIENPVTIFDSHLPIERQMEIYLKLMKDLPEANKLKNSDLLKQEAEQLKNWEKTAENMGYIEAGTIDRLETIKKSLSTFRKLMTRNRTNPSKELEKQIKQWEKENDYSQIQTEIKTLTDKVNIGRTEYVKNNILNDIQWDDVSTFFTEKVFKKSDTEKINEYKKSLDKKGIKYSVKEDGEKIQVIVESERYSFGIWKLLCAYKEDSGGKGCRYCWLSALNKIAGEGAIPELQKQAIIKGLDKVAANPRINIVELLNDGSYFNKTEFPEELQKLVMQKIADTPHVLSVAVETRPEYFDVAEVQNALSILREDQKLNIYFGLETLDNFVNGPLNNKGYGYQEFEKQIEKLAKGLTQEQKSRVSISAYNFMKPAYLTEQEAINATIEMTKKIKELEARTGIQMYIKMEPPVITGGTIQKLNYDKIVDGERQYDVMNYYSVAEIIAKMSLENLHESIIVGGRADMDPMTITSMIRNIKDPSRFSQFDAIVYNAVQRFNQTRDPKNFLEDIYFGIKGSEEFVDWEKKLYGENGGSGLAKLMKMVDEKGIFEGNTKRRNFVDNMWKGFDQIEYTDTRLTDILRTKGEDGIDRARKRVEAILKKHNLELDTTIGNNIQFHFVDNGIKGKDKILKTNDLNSNYGEVTDKAGYNIQLTLRDEDGAPYIGWLFVPLKHDGTKKHMESPFSLVNDFEKLTEEEQKIELLKKLSKDSEIDLKILEKINLDKHIKLSDIKKLEAENIKINDIILRMYKNLIDKNIDTNFYDFIKNFPKNFLKKQDLFSIKSDFDINDYKNSRIYENKFEKVPSHYVSIFHYTSGKYLDDITKTGLKSIKKLGEENIYYKAIRSKKMAQLDKAFDSEAPNGFTRFNSVYGYHEKQTGSTMGNGNICLELKVDPDKVLVANAEYFTEASIKGVGGWSKEYWETAMTLTEYNKLNPEEKKHMFTFPEVIIPDGVTLDFISLKKENN